MVRTLTKSVKKQNKSAGTSHSGKPVKKISKPAGEEEEIVAPVVAIGKAAFVVDEPEVLIGVEEKVDDDGVVITDDAEEEGEEATLDAEEINPFGDKWEE